MTWEIAYVFAVIALALALFVSERFPVDQVAIGIPVALWLGGVLSPADAVSGFSNVATITVAAMLVLSLGLVKTGAVATLGRWAQDAPLGGRRRRLVVLCIVVAGISPFLNNTAVVVVFLPIFLAVAKQADEPPSIYLIPLSYAAILGGTVSLIGTSTNLIVYGMARSRGFDELSMFSITPLGLIYVGIGLLYLMTVGRALLPRRAGQADLAGKYDVREFMTELRVTASTPSAGRTFAEVRWGEEHGVSIVGLQRGDRAVWGPVANRRVTPGDLLYAQGDPQSLLELARKERLETPAAPSGARAGRLEEGAKLGELLVGPTSPLVGRTLKETRFQQLYDATVLAVQHHGRTVRGRLADVRLERGDLLLVHGTAEALEALADAEGFVPLGEVRPPVGPRPRALVAVLILVSVVVAAGTELVGIMPAALTGVTLMVFLGCVRLEEIYEELDWRVVFLLAGAIPLGVAMDETGAAEWLGHGVAEVFGPLGPRAVVGGLYLMTSLMTSIMSNNATAVVLTPIALLTAEDLGMNPYALLVAVMFGASAEFMTPIGYQTNTLIYGPGGYRFSDYVKVGGPLNLLLLITATVFIPIFWPS
ncbi:MAG TPA: SLC13 family permease [Gemmatimonadota bacterium]|nr:SLC13 family permease [Gemmatimonadota bacterium]